MYEMFFSWKDLVDVNTKTWKTLSNFLHDFGLLQIKYFNNLSHELSIFYFSIQEFHNFISPNKFYKLNSTFKILFGVIDELV